MRDYTYVSESGERMAIATMPTALILALLRDGFEVSACDGYCDPLTAVRKRLDLELFIRSRGLRG